MQGPLVDWRRTWLWWAWLAWSRYRLVLPIRDKTLPKVIACIYSTLGRFGVSESRVTRGPLRVLLNSLRTG
jgi:hypothetical protein